VIGLQRQLSAKKRDGSEFPVSLKIFAFGRGENFKAYALIHEMDKQQAEVKLNSAVDNSYSDHVNKPFTNFKSISKNNDLPPSYKPLKANKQNEEIVADHALPLSPVSSAIPNEEEDKKPTYDRPKPATASFFRIE
jgi:hypothetical protein